MDLSALSIVELKQMAKNHTPRIKQYYIKSKSELIRLLTMDELPMDMIVEKKTIGILREEANARGFVNVWKLRRPQLVALLYPVSKPCSEQYNQDEKHAEKHDNPQTGEGEEVGVDVGKHFRENGF